MDIILLSDNKLKVKLSPDDMKNLSISCDNMDYDDTSTRRAFWDILDKAKEKTGFDAARERVFIQVYPSRDGGCDMYVTKASALENTEKVSVKSMPSPVKSQKWLVYSFNNIHNMLCVCDHLERMGYQGQSRAFCEKRRNLKEIFYLVLWDFSAGHGKGNELIRYEFILDYGQKHKSFITLSYLGEHAQCIAEKHAVETLARLR